jgi:hypothetical protein
MKERPILFSGAMVRAILAGTKTQTRRIAKGVHIVHAHTSEALTRLDSAGPRISCPYGQPGDRLWVRECWARDDEDGALMYRADLGLGGSADDWERNRLDGVPRFRWRPSIHMPRAASRITLEVTGVRVERLQAISIEDAKAEGVTFNPLLHTDPRESFIHLWTSINGAESWAANPWVWVVEFQKA